MKISNFNLLLLTVFSVGLFFTACDNQSKTETQTEQATKKGKAYTSAYVCPMHCEGSGSSQPGECPACGMEYVKNEEHSH